jgi:hypothetical protein
MAVKRGVKAKEGENLDDASIARVIGLLEGEQPITKKAACEILNIAYNTTRLGTIIAGYQEKLDRRKKNFEKNKGIPLTDSDVSYIVRGILMGEAVSELSEMLFRPVSQINKVILDLGLPKKVRGEQLAKCQLLPDECVITEASVGQIVWSARYHAAAEIIKPAGRSKDNLSDLYSVYVFEPTENKRRGGFYAYQRIEDLGKLDHLSKYINIEQLTK